MVVNQDLILEVISRALLNHYHSYLDLMIGFYQIFYCFIFQNFYGLNNGFYFIDLNFVLSFVISIKYKHVV